MKPHLVRASLLLLLIGGLIFTDFRPALADSPLQTRYTAEGHYGIVMNGTGMGDNPLGNIPLTVPGTPVRAYLYWSGLDLQSGGDDTVSLTVDGGTPLSLTADITYGPSFWIDVRYTFTYVEDITALIQPGTHTYTLSDLVLSRELYGAGITVVYEDPTLPLTRIELKDGSDGFFHGWTGDLGPNSEVSCFTFDPAAVNRTFTYGFFAGGVSLDAEPRPDALWSMIGNGTLPTVVIDAPGAFEINNASDAHPFDSHNGPQWDTLTTADTDIGALTIPAGATFVCFQAESVTDEVGPQGQVLNGASMTLLAISGGLQLEAAQVEPASLGDFVWSDTNGNGIQDAGEPGISGVTVTLFNAGGTPVGTTTTNASGGYSFTGLTPGDYSVGFTPPAGYTFAPANQGGSDGLDSDADTTGRTATTTLAAGENDVTWDAGLIPPAPQTASIGDFVWSDTNGNGIQDAGEPGISGVTVTLFNAGGTPVGTTTTNASGGYSFTGLTPGDYSVGFTPPTGYTFAPANQGGSDGLDSDADTTGRTAVTTLVAGENDITWDAGLIPPAPQTASIGDFVWRDTNGNGIQDVGESGFPNVTVNLYTAGGTLVSTTTTNGSGFYRFTGLTPGDYFVEVVLPNSSYTFAPANQGGSDGLDSDTDTTTGRTAVTTLTAGENDLTWDAGLIGPPPNQNPPPQNSTPHPTLPASSTIIDPGCVKLGDPLTVAPGEVVKWSITARNTGAVPLTGVVVNDPLDPAFFSEVIDTATPQGTVTVNGLTVTFDLGTINVGESVTMSVVVRARGDLTPPVTAVNRATVRTNERPDCPAQSSVTISNSITTLPSTGYAPPIAQDTNLNRLLLVIGLLSVLVGGWFVWRRGR